jgi:hypothetical protein
MKQTSQTLGCCHHCHHHERVNVVKERGWCNYQRLTDAERLNSYHMTCFNPKIRHLVSCPQSQFREPHNGLITCCFCMSILTDARSLPVSSDSICFSKSSIHVSISSQVWWSKTSRFASKSLSPFSLVVRSRSSNCWHSSEILGSISSASSGFSFTSSFAACNT